MPRKSSHRRFSNITLQGNPNEKQMCCYWRNSQSKIIPWALWLFFHFSVESYFIKNALSIILSQSHRGENRHSIFLKQQRCFATTRLYILQFGSADFINSFQFFLTFTFPCSKVVEKCSLHFHFSDPRHTHFPLSRLCFLSCFFKPFFQIPTIKPIKWRQVYKEVQIGKMCLFSLVSQSIFHLLFNFYREFNGGLAMNQSSMLWVLRLFCLSKLLKEST